MSPTPVPVATLPERAGDIVLLVMMWGMFLAMLSMIWFQQRRGVIWWTGGSSIEKSHRPDAYKGVMIVYWSIVGLSAVVVVFMSYVLLRQRG